MSAENVHVIGEFNREEALEELADSIEQDKKRRARWPNDLRVAMTELAKLFPTLRNVPGTDPWDAEALIAWLNTGAPTSGSKWAAMFLLNVWNVDTDWRKCGLKRSRTPNGKFDLGLAMSAWDVHHVRAMQEWIANPFWP